MKTILAIVFSFSSLVPTQDKGIGLIFFSEHSPFSDSLQSDSLIIYQYPEATSQEVASFALIIDKKNRGYRYHIHSKRPLFSENLCEYDYEVLGLPIDTINESTQWFRVVYGFSDHNRPMKGWVKYQKPHCDFFLWATRLPKKVLYFEPEPKQPEFFDNPNGKQVQMKLYRLANPDSRRFSYSLHPLEVRGSWMKVRVVSPSTMAQLPDLNSPTVWIRYLDKKGRPLVYYYARD